VNLHDGALPARRGLGATPFSIYEGDAVSGFTYHRMVPGLDEGPILVEGSVPIGPDATAAAVGRAKAAAAAGALPAVFDAIEAGDPGRAQAGPGGSHSAADVRSMVAIPDPSALTADELRRRVRAFGFCDVRLGGPLVAVHRLRRGTQSVGAVASGPADGELLRPHRIDDLPVPIAQAIARRRRER
jgi:methionyl-tRNA formyltransferase